MLKRSSHLKVTRSELYLAAYDVSKQVEEHAPYLARATGGRIGPQTATEIRALAKRMAELHAARPARGVGPVRPAMLAVRKLTTTLRAALATIVEEHPELEEQLRATRPSGVKSASVALHELDLVVALFTHHARRLLPMFPRDFHDHLARTRRALLAHEEQREDAEQAFERHYRELEDVEARLQKVLRTVRAHLALRESIASVSKHAQR